MGTRPPPTPVAPPTARRAAPLRSADRLSLPVGQDVLARVHPERGIDRAIREAVAAGGFSVVESTLTIPGDSTGSSNRPASGILIAERKVRRVATSGSMRVSIIVLVAAGAGLGGLDLFVGGSWTYAVPWVVIAAVGAFLLWLRYGRSYESEVIAVSLIGLPAEPSSLPDAQPPPGGPSETSLVRWSAGRIRSVAFAGIRAAVDVKDCPIPLMDALTQAVRKFQSAAG